MKARQIIETLIEAAPAAPAPTKPATKPVTKPKEAPAEPKPRKYENPWRRRGVTPGEEPAPKACAVESARRSPRARDLFA
jgi:hypothetical protein